jgi:hypothetical protein
MKPGNKVSSNGTMLPEIRNPAVDRCLGKPPGSLVQANFAKTRFHRSPSPPRLPLYLYMRIKERGDYFNIVKLREGERRGCGLGRGRWENGGDSF